MKAYNRSVPLGVQARVASGQAASTSSDKEVEIDEKDPFKLNKAKIERSLRSEFQNYLVVESQEVDISREGTSAPTLLLCTGIRSAPL